MKTKFLLTALLITINSFGQDCNDKTTCDKKTEQINTLTIERDNLIKLHKYDYISYSRTINYLENSLNNKNFKIDFEIDNEKEDGFSELTSVIINFEGLKNPINLNDIASNDDIKYDEVNKQITFTINGKDEYLKLEDENENVFSDETVQRIINALRHLKDILNNNNSIKKNKKIFN